MRCSKRMKRNALAKSEHNEINLMSDIDDERSVYRDGKVVIYGTKSAVNDARSK